MDRGTILIESCLSLAGVCLRLCGGADCGGEMSLRLGVVEAWGWDEVDLGGEVLRIGILDVDLLLLFGGASCGGEVGLRFGVEVGVWGGGLVCNVCTLCGCGGVVLNFVRVQLKDFWDLLL